VAYSGQTRARRVCWERTLFGLVGRKFGLLVLSKTTRDTHDITGSSSSLALYVPIRDQPRVELVQGHPGVFSWATSGLFGMRGNRKVCPTRCHRVLHPLSLSVGPPPWPLGACPRSRAGSGVCGGGLFGLYTPQTPTR
jgi:hypothetical protein